MRFPTIRFNALFTVLAAAACAFALQGCGTAASAPSEGGTRSAVGQRIQGEEVLPPYSKNLSLWAGDALRRPAPAAMLDPAKGGIPNAADMGALERLTIGMTEQDVVAALGAPSARGERGMWQYVVRNAQDAYAATLWFNDEQRLWIGQTDRAPLSSLFTARAPVVAVAPPPPAIKKTITLSASELFAFGNDSLRMPQPKLDAIAETLLTRGTGGEALVVNGYTDHLGSDAHNLALSQRRAEAVRSYLVRKGVAPNRVSAVGKGEANPVVACDGIKDRTALIACLAPNRRVEIEPLTLEVSAISLID